jgi:hypothetical protein
MPNMNEETMRGVKTIQGRNGDEVEVITRPTRRVHGTEESEPQKIPGLSHGWASLDNLKDSLK